MSGNPDHAHSDESAYNRALQIIRAAARGDTTIDLSSNQLTALPPEIGELKKPGACTVKRFDRGDKRGRICTESGQDG